MSFLLSYIVSRSKRENECRKSSGCVRFSLIEGIKCKSRSRSCLLCSYGCGDWVEEGK
jgi:hypothetical protein